MGGWLSSLLLSPAAAAGQEFPLASEEEIMGQPESIAVTCHVGTWYYSHLITVSASFVEEFSCYVMINKHATCAELISVLESTAPQNKKSIINLDQFRITLETRNTVDADGYSGLKIDPVQYLDFSVSNYPIVKYRIFNECHIKISFPETAMENDNII